MGQTFFSFQGRLGPSAFIKAALILVAIGIALNLIQQFIPETMGPVLMLVALVTYWPWLAIWAKRYHDGDSSGWMVLLPILALMILSGIVTFYFMNQVMNAMGMTFAEMADPAKAEAFKVAIKAKAMVILPVNVVAQLIIIFGFNAMIKSDPEENRFGMPTA